MAGLNLVGGAPVPLPGSSGGTGAGGTAYVDSSSALLVWTAESGIAGSRTFQVTAPLTATLTSGALTLGFSGAATVIGETPSGIVDGTNAAFTLANAPTQLAVYLNGLRQSPASYAVSGDGVTLAAPPEPGDTLLADYTY